MSTVYIWQGFEHEWLREVLGFRLAHRLSSLVNYIEVGDAGATMVAGATPGVDGNYMDPKCFYRRVEAPEVESTTRVVELVGTDSLDETGAAPEATMELAGQIDCECPSGIECDAILAGIDFRWNCDPGKQPAGWPGNSNGMWPAEIDVAIDPLVRNGTTCTWPVRVRVVRGWTPMRGGVPLIAEKRLNHTLDLRAQVHVQVLSGKGLRLERREPVLIEGTIRSEQRLRCDGSMAQEPGDVACLTHFGFSIPHHEGKGAKRHRGRYLSAIGFGVEDGDQGARAWGRVWAPVTVVPAPVQHRVTVAELHLGDRVSAGGQRCASGSVHSNSSEQAPFFSYYKKFPETREVVRVPID